jgi:hypothetical protein
MKSYLIPILIILLAACQKEPGLKPPAPFEKPYQLPQGNAPVDATIMTIYNQYGCYVLYRFTQEDYAYDYSYVSKDTAFPANPKYIDTALNFFRQQLMAVYPESFLRNTMPYKILLASHINNWTTGSVSSRNKDGFDSNRSTLTLGWADSALVLKTPAETRKLRGLMHCYYWERAYKVGRIEVPPAFIASAPIYAQVNSANRYANGVVSNEYGLALNLGYDLIAYVSMITGNSLQELEASYFLPSVDSKGLIRKRYNYIVDYYKNEFGIDLQAIGNLQ